MKILCACGQGLGSSFLVEMNVAKVIKKLGIEDVEITHASVADVHPGVADLFILGSDLVDSVRVSNVIAVDNIVSLPELEEKLTNYFKEKKVI